MSVKMKFGSKDIPFVYKGDKLIYPNPIKDGLLLWYDFKGMRNTDTNKEVTKDLSGNGNDGTLTNFNFTEGSGYKDNTLVFDGVDDKLTIPELELDETVMSVMHDGKLYAYEDDKVLTVGEDGEIYASGKNLLLDSKLLSTSDEYNIQNLDTVTKIPHDTPMTLTIKAKIGSDRTGFMFFNNQGVSNYRLADVPKKDDNFYTYSIDFNWIEDTKDRLRVFQVPHTGTSETSIEWVKLEKRNSKPLYSPAPEDYKTTTLAPTLLTDLQLYNKTLRKDELLHNAESKGLKKLKPSVPVQDGLTLHYDFSHESNTSEYKDKAFDYSGNGNHGVLNNFNFTEESGYDGDKLLFDGVDDYVQVPELEKTSEYSLFITLLKKKGGDSSHIVGFSNGNTYFRIEGGIRLYFFGQSHDGAQNYYSGFYSPRIFETDFEGVISVGLTVNRDTLKLFFNGEQVGEDKKYEGNLLPLQLEYVGRYLSTYSINPTYSTKFYNRPLTPEEIAHNFEIEKEKFPIATSLPVGQGKISETFKVGGDI